MLKNRAVKSMRKKIRTSVLVLAWCISMTVSVCAASAAAVMGTYTGESDLSVYVRGTDLGKDDVNVQIGNLEADKVRTQLVEELDMPMQTLIMVDNSLSITPKNQKKISRFLQYLISDRLANEEIGIATFSEEARKLVDYTSEYEALMRAADNISYQRQSTYLTDALYDLMKAEYIENPTDTFRRILVISDGVDNKSIGYTKEELYSLIKDLQIPVYTIGCKNGKNNEELENMFALSRITNAEYFLLDKVKAKDLLDITSALKQDRTAVKLAITPPKEQMDGSRKAVKITFPNHSPLTAEMMMPQPILEEEPQQTDSREDETEKPEPKSNEEEKTGLLVIVLIAGGIAAAVAAFFLNQRKKNRQQEPDFERIEHENDLKPLNAQVVHVEDNAREPEQRRRERRDEVLEVFAHSREQARSEREHVEKHEHEHDGHGNLQEVGVERLPEQEVHHEKEQHHTEMDDHFRQGENGGNTRDGKLDLVDQVLEAAQHAAAGAKHGLDIEPGNQAAHEPQQIRGAVGAS